MFNNSIHRLSLITGDLAGSYFPLATMTKEVEDDLQNCGFLFQKPTPNNVLANCGAARGTYFFLIPTSSTGTSNYFDNVFQGNFVDLSSCTVLISQTGQMAVASSTTRRRPSLCGWTKRITCVASPCRLEWNCDLRVSLHESFYHICFIHWDFLLMIVTLLNLRMAAMWRMSSPVGLEPSTRWAHFSFCLRILQENSLCPPSVTSITCKQFSSLSHPTLYLIFLLYIQTSKVEGTLKSAGYGYAYNDHLGYITTCPSNVGTGLRASVMLKLPKLYKVRISWMRIQFVDITSPHDFSLLSH